MVQVPLLSQFTHYFLFFLHSSDYYTISTSLSQESRQNFPPHPISSNNPPHPSTLYFPTNTQPLYALLFYSVFPMSFPRQKAAYTAPMTFPLNPPFSKYSTLAIDVPPGEQTWSFSSAELHLPPSPLPGCRFVWITISAAPRAVYAARFIAKSRGRPDFTPPSASASISM